MRTKKKAAPKKRKLTLTLTAKEYEVIKRYAQDQGQSKQDAIRRIVKKQLADYIKSLEMEAPSNQLGLFDSLQIDIFDRTEKVEE